MTAVMETSASPAADVDPHTPRLLMPLARVLWWLNRGMLAIGMVGLLVASLVLTYSVLSRYFMHASTDWQDEAAVFCLVGATFLTSAFVQQLRGHIGIEAIASWLPPAANRIRMLFVDALCVAFCALFAWKSCTLLRDAWVDNQTTSSSWAPPLWIPYGLMAGGMILLTLQIAVQLIASINSLSRGSAR
jgi:TRAP-type C4-dicarboxylate transport system permease small subunit